MMILDKISSYIKKRGIRHLSDETGVCIEVIQSLLVHKRLKYNTTTLDLLYTFFGLEKDNFYIDNMKKRYPKTPSLLGTLVRKLRVNKGLSLEEFARETKVDKRALARLESGDSLPTFNSRTIQTIIKTLDMSESQQKTIKAYIQASKDIEKQIRDYHNEKNFKPNNC